MIDPKTTRIGVVVRHMIEGYIGTFDGITTMKSLFEKPSDQVGCRVHVQSETRRRVAPPDNLELLIKGPSLEEKHKLILQGLGLE